MGLYLWQGPWIFTNVQIFSYKQQLFTLYSIQINVFQHLTSILLLLRVYRLMTTWLVNKTIISYWPYLVRYFRFFCLSNWLGLTIAAVLAQRTGMAIFLCLFVDWSSLDAAFKRKAYSSDLCLQPNLYSFFYQPRCGMVMGWVGILLFLFFWARLAFGLTF